MTKVRAKKKLGQHFLKDLSIAQRVASCMELTEPTSVLEVGPGMGVLSQYLLQDPMAKLTAIEIDRESVDFLTENLPALKVIEGDFLTLDLKSIYGEESFTVIGNFPYNISSQIFFKVLEYRDQIPICAGMLQQEVGKRIASPCGSKVYGITSVLLQAFFDIDYLFSVDEDVFDPPPKVKSAVIRMRRNNVKALPCDEKFFFRVVKTAFNQRRKTLRNSLKSMLNGHIAIEPIFSMRPEQLSVDEFIKLTQLMATFK